MAIDLLLDNVPMGDQRTKINDTITQVNTNTNVISGNTEDISGLQAHGGMVTISGLPSLSAGVWTTVSNSFINAFSSSNGVTVNTTIGTLTPTIGGRFEIEWNIIGVANVGEGVSFGISINGSTPDTNKSAVIVGNGATMLETCTGKAMEQVNGGSSISLMARADSSSSGLGFSRGYFSIKKLAGT